MLIFAAKGERVQLQRQTAAGLCLHQRFVDVPPPPCTEWAGKADQALPLYAGFHQLGTALQPIKPTSGSWRTQTGRQRHFPESWAPCCESELQEENPTHEATQTRGGKERRGSQQHPTPAAQILVYHLLSPLPESWTRQFIWLVFH